jgi:hypothetical protein
MFQRISDRLASERGVPPRQRDQRKAGLWIPAGLVRLEKGLFGAV